MIIGLGEDLVDIQRIARLVSEKGERFLSKCFTENEIVAASLHKEEARRIAHYAKRYAAKEACLKALGTGMREGLQWHDMEIGNDRLGRPVLSVYGGVAEKLNGLTPKGRQSKVHITLADEAGLAKATVILEAT